MITAKDAAKNAERAVRKIRAETQKRAKKADADRKKQVRWYLKHEVPQHLKQAQKEISDAVAAGQKSCELYLSPAPMFEAIDKIEKALRARGFSIGHTTRSFDTDYGDFNAPCHITETATTFSISWKK
jgi:hypothetical protein